MSCDRQTDKATWWSITAFDEAEKTLLSGDTFPPFVVRVYGGLEECPDTKRIHFQGAVQCKGQQRFSAIKKWLPKAHIEAARSADALRKYAMKEETAVSEKKEVVNKAAYVDNQTALRLLAAEEINDCYEPHEFKDMDHLMDLKFREYANRIVYKQPYLVGVMSKPDVMRGWKLFGVTFVRLAKEGRGDSITPRPENQVVDPEDDSRSQTSEEFWEEQERVWSHKN